MSERTRAIKEPRLTGTDLYDAMEAWALEPEQYENGWSFLVEAWDYEQFAKEVGSHVCTLKGAIAKLQPLADMFDEQMLAQLYPDGLPEDHPKARGADGELLNPPVTA